VAGVSRLINARACAAGRPAMIRIAVRIASLYMRAAADRLLHIENVIHHALVRHSVMALRISVGAVFLGFGLLKYFPGVSPAENLAKTTADLLTFGLVPGGVNIVIIATLECFIGLCLITGRGMRLAIWLLAFEFVGILSPLFLLPGRLFAGPHGAPTLEGQYVLKDVILVGAGMVIAAATFRGGRLVRNDLPPAAPAQADRPLAAEQKLLIVLDGLYDESAVAELCAYHGISESEFHDWRERSVRAATRALAADAEPVPADPVCV